MTEETGRLLALPYQLLRDGEPEALALARTEAIIQHLTGHPYWFSAPLTPQEVRYQVVTGLQGTDVSPWEVWQGGQMVGMLLLSRIVPNVDAVLHFTFWGTNLFAARKLIWSFIGTAFEQGGFQRLSMEIPEHTKGVLSFARQKLGFQFEGENGCARHPIGVFLGSDAAKKHGVLTHEPALWMAKQGSRREEAHWDPKTRRYRDVYLLRLLRREFLERTLPAPVRATSLSEGTSDVDGFEASEVRTVHQS